MTIYHYIHKPQVISLLLRGRDALLFKQSALPLRTPAISAKATVLVDHPVAGNDDSDGIGRNRAGDRSNRLRTANRSRYLAVRTRRAVGYGAEFFPHAPLKCR